MSQPISITIRMPVETLKFNRGVLASCGILEVRCVGDSTGDALNELASVLTRRLESRFETGQFYEVFRCGGYSALAKNPGSAQGRYLDIELKLGVPEVEHAMPSPRYAASSPLLSTWMT